MSAPLATAADIPATWVEALATVLWRKVQAYRPGAHALTIEVQSIKTGEWMPLNLPTNGALFADAATRDAVLVCLDKSVQQASSSAVAEESFFTKAQHDQARRIANTMAALTR
jgi:hypothetical protein